MSNDDLLQNSLAGMFEEITQEEQGKHKRNIAPVVANAISGDKKLERLEQIASGALQTAYVHYLQHELPDQGKATYTWDEAFDPVITHLYPQDRIILVPKAEEVGILSTPVFRQQIMGFTFTKEMVAEYIRAKTGDEYIKKTTWYQKMPETMNLLELIKYLGPLGTELADFTYQVLSKATQDRFSIHPHSLALSLPPEKRIIYTLIIEQGIKSQEICFNGKISHFTGIENDQSQEYQRLEDRFELFKRNLRTALPSITTVNQALQKHNLPYSMEEIIEALTIITQAYTEPWRNLIEKRRQKFARRHVQDKRRGSSIIIKAEEFDEYVRQLKEKDGK